MAIVCPGKFVYLPTPFTGDDETAEALRQLPGAFVAHDKRHGIGHYATWPEVRGLCEDRLTGAEMRFTTVRNPYDILVEWYLHGLGGMHSKRFHLIHGRDWTIREFLDNMLERNARPFLVEGQMLYQLEACRQWARYENLQSEVNQILRKIPGSGGPVVVRLRARNPPRDHWSAYYDDATYAWVNEHFQAPIVKLGYAFVWSNESLV